MLNSATAQPVTHVLLFDGDAPQLVRDLGDNTRLVSDCYRRLLFTNSDSIMELKYRVVFAVPEASSIAPACKTVSAALKAQGIYAYIAQVKSEDMFVYQGKVGLLSSVLWCVAGAVLLNEVPISEQQAKRLLHQANRFAHTSHHLILMKQGWFGKGFRFGLIRSDASIGHLLRGALVRFPDHHSVSDILRAMEANCSGQDLFILK